VSDRRNPQQPDRRRALARPGGRRATDPPAEWITITAFADRYGVNRHIVYKWLANKLLDIYEVGSLLRIRNLPPDQHDAAAKNKSATKCAPTCAPETPNPIRP
jgi:hypothetical protein